MQRIIRGLEWLRPGWEPRWRGHYLVLTLVLLAYALLHIPWLAVPTFNDEAFCYYPGILHQWAYGLGLLPSSVPSELSRGHPPLFFFVYGLWAKVFGATIPSVRTFSMLLTLLWLLSVWQLAARLTRPRWAWAVLAALLVQPIVFTQSTMILPEVLIALLFTQALHAWLDGRKAAYLLWAFLLVWTKETTVVLIGLLAAWQLGMQLYSRQGVLSRKFLSSLGITLAPIALGMAYLLLQKLTWGFWLLPEHRGAMQYRSILERFALWVGPELWGRQGRWWWAAVWVLFPLWRNYLRAFTQRVPLWANGQGGERLSIPLVLLFLTLALGYNLAHSPFLTVMRYYLCVLPLFLLGALQLGRGVGWRPAPWLALGGGMLLGVWHLAVPSDRVDEVNLSYAQQTQTDQAAIAWLEEQEMHHAAIYTQIVFKRKLRHPYNGYTRQPFTAVTLRPDAPWTHYVVTADFATRWRWLMGREPREVFTLPNTRPLKIWREGNAWTAVYIRTMDAGDDTGGRADETLLDK